MNINATNSAIGVHHPAAQRSAESRATEVDRAELERLAQDTAEPRATQQPDTVSISEEARFRNAQALAERRAAQTEGQPREALRSSPRNPGAAGPAGIG